MDSRLDRYISYEYLVSPCPQGARNTGADSRSLAEVQLALQRVTGGLETLRAGGMLDEKSAAQLAAVEQELSRAAAMLESMADRSWLA